MTDSKSAVEQLTIEGCRLRVVVDGDEAQPALVLAHMLGTDLSLWDDLVPALAERFRVIRLDARGHGGSDLGPAPVTIERLGRDVVAVLDALGVARAHVLGLSMGGAVGLWLLAHAPARVERAIIAGSGAKLGDAATWNGRIATALADGMEPTIEATIERWFSPAYVEAEPGRVDRIRSLVRATAPEGFAACCAALRDMDLREAVRAASQPVLVVRGADDPSVTADTVDHLIAALENATFVELPARHCLAVEVEAELLEAAMRFLTAKAAPGRSGGRTASVKHRAAPRDGRSSSTRRSAARSPGDVRRPVATTAPVSGKAVAKASASRKVASRTAPRPSDTAGLRRAVAAPTGRSAREKTAPAAKRRGGATPPGGASVPLKSVRQAAGPSSQKRVTKPEPRRATAPVTANRKPAGRATASGSRPVTAAALRAASSAGASSRGKATAARAAAARPLGEGAKGRAAATKAAAPKVSARAASAKTASPRSAPKTAAPKIVAPTAAAAKKAPAKQAGKVGAGRVSATAKAPRPLTATPRGKAKVVNTVKTVKTAKPTPAKASRERGRPPTPRPRGRSER